MRSLKIKSVSVEAGLMDMLTRMQTGRFKVFRHLNDWFEEFRIYHRKDGKVVKEGDDLISYALRDDDAALCLDESRLRRQIPRADLLSESTGNLTVIH